ncbi:MAG: hypothetical protein AABM43_06810 [Actinomycetota bacterium]
MPITSGDDWSVVGSLRFHSIFASLVFSDSSVPSSKETNTWERPNTGAVTSDAGPL